VPAAASEPLAASNQQLRREAPPTVASEPPAASSQQPRREAPAIVIDPLVPRREVPVAVICQPGLEAGGLTTALPSGDPWGIASDLSAAGSQQPRREAPAVVSDPLTAGFWQPGLELVPDFSKMSAQRPPELSFEQRLAQRREKAGDSYADLLAGRWPDMEGCSLFANLNGPPTTFAMTNVSREDSSVPNTAPPLMRYVVNPKDGCVESLQDTHQPAHVPLVAAAALAALEAAGWEGERGRERRCEEARRQSAEDMIADSASEAAAAGEAGRPAGLQERQAG